MRQLFNAFRRRQVEKSLNLNWYITINLHHDARQEWLISMQTSMSSSPDNFYNKKSHRGPLQLCIPLLNNL